MANLIRIPLPIKIDRLTRIAQVRGADVYVHWSVLLIAALMLIAATRGPLLTIAGISGWLAIMFIHEWGHAFAAQQYQSHVLCIELYPIIGYTRFEAPWSRFAECVIVWAGVIAQTIVAIPVITFLLVHGYTNIEPVNALLALLGPYSLAMVVLNLLPVGRLDGATAWKLLPALFKTGTAARAAAVQSRWR